MSSDTRAINQGRAQALDWNDRLKASTALEHEASACSTQQGTNFAAAKAPFKQQLAASQANDEQSLRARK